MNNRDLREMRKAVEGLFPDYCNLLTVTRTSDGAGGFTQGWGTAVKNCPCRVDDDGMSDTERLAPGGLRPLTTLEICLPYDTTITEKYRIEHSGFTYNVISIDRDQSWQIEKVATVERTD
jgi:SPP1 family predicted phage head-tail adaptor